jgi:hypothetical protein
MPPILRLIALLAVSAATLGGASRALACGSSNGYTYAGMSSTSRAYGISARITPLTGFDVLAGHVAGWVGVGGPGEGPGHSDEWLQVGLSGFPGFPGNQVYYELAQPHRYPSYHQVAANLPFGKPVKVSVLEMHNRPNWWRVWLNHRPVSKPIRLPESHDRWSPIATAESWDGGSGGVCNSFLYRFRHVSIALAPGGGWHRLSNSYEITGPTTRLRRSTRRASFIAAEGDVAVRTLLALTP